MGNSTQVENDFNLQAKESVDKLLVERPELKNNNDALQREITKQFSQILLNMRMAKMQELCNVTGRNLICYFSAWLQFSSKRQMTRL